MGTLLSLATIKEHEAKIAPWYFDDTYYSIDSRTYVFAWPSKQFEYLTSIHSDVIRDVKTSIRRWIELRVAGTVIYDTCDKSYRIYYTPDQDWHRSHSIENMWYRFWFDNPEDATAFTLQFSDVVSPITSTHPTRHYTPEF
jgi:hypothetical protein